jgi:hypothetical protein
VDDCYLGLLATTPRWHHELSAGDAKALGEDAPVQLRLIGGRTDVATMGRGRPGSSRERRGWRSLELLDGPSGIPGGRRGALGRGLRTKRIYYLYSTSVRN